MGARRARRRAPNFWSFPNTPRSNRPLALVRRFTATSSATLAKVAELAARAACSFIAISPKSITYTSLLGSGPVREVGRALSSTPRNSITPDGAVGEQEKLVMTPFEREWGVSAGGPVACFRRRSASSAIAICYDSEFPLLVRGNGGGRSRSRAGAVMHRARLGLSPRPHGAMARALENTIATVQSPTVGDAPWSPAVDFNAGAAGIYVPSEQGVSDTGVLAEGTLNAAEWVTATIDLRGSSACARRARCTTTATGRCSPARRRRSDVEIVKLHLAHRCQTAISAPTWP